MNKNVLSGFYLAGLLTVASTSALADDAMFDPRMSCDDVQSFVHSSVEKQVFGAWLLGAKSTIFDGEVNFDKDVLENEVDTFLAECSNSDSVSQAQSPEFSIPDDGIRFLNQFLDPNANHFKLTQDLIPTAEEIGMMYEEPLASALVSHVKDFIEGYALNPDVSRGGLQVFWATTTEMKAGNEAMLYEFPGGYGRINQYMKEGIWIARFKMGGISFDGLAYVNNRWIWIPKPWRVAP